MNDFWELVHRHRSIALAIAGAMCFLAGVMILWRLAASFSEPTSPPRVAQAYFYDLNTRELFTAAADAEDPLVTASGDFQGHPAGVRAVVFSCGSCNDPQQRFIGWLETPAPDVVEPEQLIDFEETANTGGDEPSGLLVRSLDGSQWHPFESPEAESIIRQAQSRCGVGETLRPCTPPSVIAR